MNHLLREVLPALGLDEGFAADRLALAGGNGLPSNLPVNTLACGAVAAAGLAGLAIRGGERVLVDPLQVSVSFRADQLQTVDGVTPSSFAPLSGFFATADGWVRTHANYPHHRERLLRALGLAEGTGRPDVETALADRSAQEVEQDVTAAGGIAVAVRGHRTWFAGEPAAAVDTHPLLEVSRHVGLNGGGRHGGGGGVDGRPVPLSRRPRVLDLTRVIAGPVATRTLALLGCDVLRVDPPQLPELEPQHVDTGAGKRSTLLDLRDADDRAAFTRLLCTADVLVTGYRPGALEGVGLGDDELAAAHPGLVHASLSAWGARGPWGGRRGFDSIVQAATGIALLESPDGTRPGALPAQALDHATGYLLAAGVMAALRRRAEEGGSWRVRAHLARTAHWLLRTDALDANGDLVPDPAPWLAGADTAYGRVVQPRPAFRIDDAPTVFPRPAHRWGTDAPEWATSGRDGR